MENTQQALTLAGEILDAANQETIEDFIEAAHLVAFLSDHKPIVASNMPLTIIYHRNCMDGMVSAYITEHIMSQAFGARDINFIPMQYGELLPDVDRDSFVIMVDFCMEPKVLSTLASLCAGLTVIDHHLGSLLKFTPGSWDQTYNVIFSDERDGHMAATHIVSLLMKWIDKKIAPNKLAESKPGLFEMAEVVGNYDVWHHGGDLCSREHYMKNFFSKFVLPMHAAECEVLGLDKRETQHNVSVLIGYMLLNWNDAPFMLEGQQLNTALVKGMAVQETINREIEVLPRPHVMKFPYGTFPVTAIIHRNKTRSELVAHLSSPQHMDEQSLLVVKVKESDEQNQDTVWSMRWRGSKESPVTALSVASAFGGGGHVAAASTRTELSDDDFIQQLAKKIANLTDSARLIHVMPVSSPTPESPT